jgi:hypothetical protein
MPKPTKPVKTLKLVVPPKKTRAEEILSQLDQAEAEPEFDESEVIRLVGGSAANGDKNDPMVFVGKAEVTIRGMVAQYGFDRMPLTYGEFHGFMDYTATLDIVIGSGIVPAARQGDWSEGGLEMWDKTMSQYREAGHLFAKGDIAALLAYHKENQVLKRLGQEFEEFSTE